MPQPEVQYGDMPKPSKHTPMQLVAERKLPDPTPQTLTTSTPTPTTLPDFGKEFVTRAAWRQGMLAAINVLTRVLAARFVVLVAVSGGIWLTSTALAVPDPYRLAALGVYALGVVIPSVWLATR